MQNIKTVASLRDAWLAYFKKNGHTHVPSASLIPVGDPTLLFTTAGMVQFKPYFAGTEEPEFKRAVTIQKCFRTTDLESVGKTARHLTMFEMLGNFSFYNDYFKEEAIRFAWDFSREHLKFDEKRIHITVYEDDDEAEEFWHKKIGVPMEQITRLGKEDNWWGPAGDSGPCGPCSELYLDRGDSYCTCDDKSSCKPGGECDRFMEYWNLVFNQYHQDTEGKLHPLPHKGIDTGAGLERIVALLNDTESVYDTDELHSIMSKTEELTEELREDKKRVIYGKDATTPFRVLADHSRSVCFAIADGIYPDNNGRGYVIRRIIRRALLFARELGILTPVLHRLVDSIVEIYGPYYPEIAKNHEAIKKRIHSEEDRFLNTLEHGLHIWEQYRQEHIDKKAKVFGGKEAFRLYDTFGFPLEMTVELAEKDGMSVDLDGFEALMEKQREAASSASSWKDIILPENLSVDAASTTEFIGYNKNESDAKVLAIVQNEREVDEIQESEEAIVIMDRTPFYGESGGQLGDTGSLAVQNGGIFLVKDTQKKGHLILHSGELTGGVLKKGDRVRARIDDERRKMLTIHHSATHLLNASLRNKLGDHIMQTGSLVAPEYLRFDFSHGEKIDGNILSSIEDEVNQAIALKAPVSSQVMPIEEARKTGAVAAFGEKYGHEVRVIRMGTEKQNLSVEFCGGCHANNTEEIGLFHILKESSPGAGNRRIEAIAGEKVVRYFVESFETIAGRITDYNDRVARETHEDADAKKSLRLDVTLPSSDSIEEKLHASSSVVHEYSEKLDTIHETLTRAEKDLIKYKKKREENQAGALLEDTESFLKKAKKIGDVTLIQEKFDDIDVKSLRTLGDALKEKSRKSVILFGAKTDKGPVLLFMANKEAVSAGANCGAMIKEAAGILGGGGGGRPDMAQAGGKDSSKLELALEKAYSILKDSLS